MLTAVLYAMGAARVSLGLAPFVAPNLSARVLGVPESHDNATGRLMARLFGVRDVGLGVLVFWAIATPEVLPFVLLFNAATDFGDCGAAAIPLIKREAIDRAAGSTLALAFSAGLLWLLVYSLAT